MKKYIAAAVFAVMLSTMATGCEENLSKEEYASKAVIIFEDYSDKFNEIVTAMGKDQRITAIKLCDEALDILDEMIALSPPAAFKDEDDEIERCCRDEKEKLTLQKEYLDLAADEDNLTDEQKQRISTIQERVGELSSRSGKFYTIVALVADKELERKPEGYAPEE